MKPPRSCLDKSFDYTPAHRTDVGKTIKRERARIKAAQESQPRTYSVTPLPARKASNGK